MKVVNKRKVAKAIKVLEELLDSSGDTELRLQELLAKARLMSTRSNNEQRN